jgi:formamidopyrimidine-DNA glycosylase
MPELPEVETMRRGLLPIVGGRIERVEYPDIPYRPIEVYPDRRELQQRVEGQRIVAVDRIAKRVLVRLASTDAIVMQPKMAGIALIADPPSSQHTRVIFHVRGVQATDRFLYWDRRGLGNVCLWNQEEVRERLLDKIGPDASVVDEKEFVQRFQDNAREVKIAMLDQTIVCGIGNLYAAEILHAARIHPKVRCHELSRVAWKRIHTHTLRILNEAIEKEGSTLSDGTYRNALNGEGGYQNEHKVYDRADELCPSCRKEKIVRIVQGQRSTFFCPFCQKTGPKSRS